MTHIVYVSGSFKLSSRIIVSRIQPFDALDVGLINFCVHCLHMAASCITLRRAVLAAVLFSSMPIWDPK